MPALMDVLFSMMIGGVIILIIFNANMITSESWLVFNNSMLVQEMLVSTATVLEGELRNMGYNVEPGKPVVLEATDTSITFLSDLRRPPTVGIPDTIKYWLGAHGEVEVENKLMRILRRSTSLDGSKDGLGYVTRFGLRYMNQQGDTLTAPVPSHQLSQVYEIEISIEVQNPYGVYRDPELIKEDEREYVYSTSFWRQTRLASRNLRR